MDLIQMLNDLVAKITDLQAKLADAQAALDEQIKISYDKGYADGVKDGNPVPTDKIYSQEELDAKIVETVAEFKARMDELEAAIIGVDKKVADSIAKVKIDILEKFMELKSKEDGAEDEFAEWLK